MSKVVSFLAELWLLPVMLVLLIVFALWSGIDALKHGGKVEL